MLTSTDSAYIYSIYIFIAMQYIFNKIRMMDFLKNKHLYCAENHYRYAFNYSEVVIQRLLVCI